MKYDVFIAHSLGMTKEAIQYGIKMEKNRWNCYIPGRDTNQKSTVYQILSQNLRAIKQSDTVHVIWDLSSMGTIFDLGMAFALDIPIFIVKTRTHHWSKFIDSNVGGYILNDPN